MIGDIALYKGNSVVHAHMVVGASDGTARGRPSSGSSCIPDP
jgi:hypothetical protein